ncbi:MAG: hypothetical protein AB7P03_15830 [Kofleriaceae bacterium]
MRAIGPCIALALAACATGATDPGKALDGGTGIEDAPIQIPAHDAAAVTTTLKQTDTAAAPSQTIACGSTIGGWTAENGWYRVFPLASFGISGAFTISEIGFAVEAARGTQSITLDVGTYAGAPGGALDTTLVTSVASTSVVIPPTMTPQLLTAPISAVIPAHSNLIVELRAEDHTNTTTYFYAGASAGPETAVAYLRAPGCGADEPQSVKSFDPTAGSVIITVTGSY